MKYSKWNLKQCSPSALKALNERGISPLAAAALAARGLDTPEKAKRFLACDESLLNDPFLMKDMDRAVLRVSRALETGESIAVYGDYDVDGITSTVLLTSYLRERGGRVQSYIPNRLEEGYGLNPEALEKLRRNGVNLIITVDCGITAVDEVELAHKMGMEVIVTDHHECKETLPRAFAVVNPHRPDCGYPFKALAGVGVALKLVLALDGPENRRRRFAQYCDLAAIGTIADVMELTGENRAIVQAGLKALETPCRPGLRALLREAGMEDRAITSTTVGFSLAPRINASGRMGCAGLACELLLTEDPGRAEQLARELCTLNRTRQSIELEIYSECVARISHRSRKNLRAIVLADSRWHQGVVGIVASRLSERFACPTFMICLQNGKGKGSCRSYGGVNLFAALEACAPLLESYGGHELAAGFTIREENIPAFAQQVNQYVWDSLDGKPPAAELELDAEISAARLLTLENVEALNLLEPFGAGNPRPVFQLSGAVVTAVTTVGGGRHTKFRVQKDRILFDAIYFSTTPEEARLSPGARVDLAFSPAVNEYRGSRTVQLQIEDVRPALSQVMAEQQLYRRFRAGEAVSAQEAAQLLPSREDFVAVWRYLERHAAGGVEETAPRLCRKIARTFGLRETFTRTMICLDVMDERGLIRLGAETDHLRIRVLPSKGKKVDLEASDIMKELRRLMGEL